MIESSGLTLPQPKPHLLSQPLRIPNRHHSMRRGRLLTCMPPRWPLALRIYHQIRHHQRTFCRTLLRRNSWHRSQPLRGGVPCPRPLRQRCCLLSSICLRYRVSSAPPHHHWWGDNQPAINLTTAHQVTRKSRHIVLKSHYVRWLYLTKQIAPMHISIHQKSQRFQISLISQPTIKHTRYPTVAFRQCLNYLLLSLFLFTFN